MRSRGSAPPRSRRVATVLIVGGRSAGTCRSAPRRRPRARSDSMRRRFTYVPFRLSRSRIVNVSPSRTSSACRRDTVTSSRNVAFGRAADERASFVGLERLARHAASGTNDERGPLMPSASRRSTSSPGCSMSKVMVVSDPVSDAQQRAAARAVVRGLRILEAALGAVRVAHSLSVGAALAVRISLRRSTSASFASPRSPAREGAQRARREGCRCVHGAPCAGTRPRPPRFRARESSREGRRRSGSRDREVVPPAAFPRWGDLSKASDVQRVNLGLRLESSSGFVLDSRVPSGAHLPPREGVLSARAE